MAERGGNRDKVKDELPVYLARPGTVDQVPRQKYGGLFCSVEGAFESKTIDFDALSVGQRGSRTPRTAKRETGQEARSPATEYRSTAGAERQRDTAQPEIRSSCGKEVLQDLGEEKVRRRRRSNLTDAACVNDRSASCTVCVCVCVCVRVLLFLRVIFNNGKSSITISDKNV